MDKVVILSSGGVLAMAAVFFVCGALAAVLASALLGLRRRLRNRFYRPLPKSIYPPSM